MHTTCCCCACSAIPDSLPPHGLEPARLLCPWTFPGKNTGVGFLLLEIFPVQCSSSHSAVSDSLQPHDLHSPWNSPGQNTGVGSLSLLQGIFPTQGLNPGLLHCRQILYQLSHKGSLGIFPTQDQTWVSDVSCTGRQILYHCATWSRLEQL